MASLITINELSVWVREELEPDDSFALAVMDAASTLVRKAGDDTWTSSTVPAVAKLVTLLVAKRTYLNPDGVVSSTVGPLSERVIDIEASGMRLSDEEVAQVQSALPVDQQSTGIWLQPITRGVLETPVYLGDNSGSDWQIPYGEPPYLVPFTPPES